MPDLIPNFNPKNFGPDPPSSLWTMSKVMSSGCEQYIWCSFCKENLTNKKEQLSLARPRSYWSFLAPGAQSGTSPSMNI